jgi:hypothetical protein
MSRLPPLTFKHKQHTVDLCELRRDEFARHGIPDERGNNLLRAETRWACVHKNWNLPLFTPFSLARKNAAVPVTLLGLPGESWKVGHSEDGRYLYFYDGSVSEKEKGRPELVQATYDMAQGRWVRLTARSVPPAETYGKVFLGWPPKDKSRASAHYLNPADEITLFPGRLTSYRPLRASVGVIQWVPQPADCKELGNLHLLPPAGSISSDAGWVTPDGSRVLTSSTREGRATTSLWRLGPEKE